MAKGDWKPKYELGDTVYFEGQKYFVCSIYAGAGAEYFHVSYGLTTDQCSPYYSGKGEQATIEEKNLITERAYLDGEIEKAKKFLAAQGIKQI